MFAAVRRGGDRFAAIMVDVPASQWCPRCGAEYEAWARTCSDCFVPLEDARPELTRSGKIADTADHSVQLFDVGDLDDERRHTLELLLDGIDSVHEWRDEGRMLVTGRSAAAEVAGLLDTLRTPPVTAAEMSDEEAPSKLERHVDRFGIASRSQRLMGFIVDAVLGTVLFAGGLAVFGVSGHEAIRRTSPRGTALAVGLAVAVGAYEVVGIAVWGRTLGKLVAGTQVTATDGTMPGWSRSLRRWALPTVFGFVPSIGALVNVVVYGPIVIDPDRRGLHDRVAETVVLRVPRSQHGGATTSA